MYLGNWKVAMMWDAYAIRILFIKINFLAWLRVLNFQEVMVLAIFVGILLKSFKERPSTSIGQPRYDPNLSLLFKPNLLLSNRMNLVVYSYWKLWMIFGDSPFLLRIDRIGPGYFLGSSNYPYYLSIRRVRRHLQKKHVGYLWSISRNLQPSDVAFFLL